MCAGRKMLWYQCGNCIIRKPLTIPNEPTENTIHLAPKSPPLLLALNLRLGLHLLQPQPLAIKRIRQPPRQLIVDDAIRIVEPDAMIAVREDVDVVVFDAREIQLVEQG